MAKGEPSAAELNRQRREGDARVRAVMLGQAVAGATVECLHVVILESPRCRARNMANGSPCGAKLAERLVYVRGVPDGPAVQCWRCGTMQVFGGEE